MIDLKIYYKYEYKNIHNEMKCKIKIKFLNKLQVRLDKIDNNYYTDLSRYKKIYEILLMVYNNYNLLTSSDDNSLELAINEKIKELKNESKYFIESLNEQQNPWRKKKILILEKIFNCSNDIIKFYKIV
tara:strand:+ start:2430 stop:2816 length:387 start_codon:yes stop_codon:yes gene_type:complete